MPLAGQVDCRLIRAKYLEIKKAKKIAELEIEKNKKLEAENKLLRGAGFELANRFKVKEKQVDDKIIENQELRKDNNNLKNEIIRLKALVSELKEQAKIAWDKGVERTVAAFKRTRDYNKVRNDTRYEP